MMRARAKRRQWAVSRHRSYRLVQRVQTLSARCHHRERERERQRERDRQRGRERVRERHIQTHCTPPSQSKCIITHMQKWIQSLTIR